MPLLELSSTNLRKQQIRLYSRLIAVDKIVGNNSNEGIKLDQIFF